MGKKKARHFFGTDGMRGTTNQMPVTAEMVLRLGMAAGKYFRNGKIRHSVVIGKDTRLSGYMLESALTAGFTAVGMDVFLFGPLPTPGVAMMTRSLRADMGVMISASHNAYQDNGIKLFGPDGYKLNDEAESVIEHLMSEDLDVGLAAPPDIGRAKRIDDAQARYVEIVKASFPRKLRLNGIRIVIDCANGATYKVAPKALWELGAEVITVGVSPNGFNINAECGSTSTGLLTKKVKEFRADIGLALDGDGDRLIVCDEKGNIANGDQLLALVTDRLIRRDQLSKNGIVSTIMSNLAFERYLSEKGVRLERTKVGDRYIVEKMRKEGYNIGGEPSGHIIFSDYSTTGDGLIAALQVLAALIESNKTASEILNVFEPDTQILRNIPYKGISPLRKNTVMTAVEKAKKELSKKGRLIIRASGTEPLIRIMTEGQDISLITKIADDLSELVRAEV